MLFTHSTLYHHIPSYILLWHTDGTHNLPVPFVFAIVKEKIQMAEKKTTTTRRKKAEPKPTPTPKKIEPKSEVFRINGEEYTLDSIQGDIAILRDPVGVPHVFARKDIKGL